MEGPNAAAGSKAMPPIGFPPGRAELQLAHQWAEDIARPPPGLVRDSSLAAPGRIVAIGFAVTAALPSDQMRKQLENRIKLPRSFRGTSTTSYGSDSITSAVCRLTRASGFEPAWKCLSTCPEQQQRVRVCPTVTEAWACSPAGRVQQLRQLRTPSPGAKTQSA